MDAIQPLMEKAAISTNDITVVGGDQSQRFVLSFSGWVLKGVAFGVRLAANPQPFFTPSARC